MLGRAKDYVCIHIAFCYNILYDVRSYHVIYTDVHRPALRLREPIAKQEAQS